MLRKAYIRHREAYPEGANTYAALDGFIQTGVEVAPFYGFGDVENLPDLGQETCVVGFIGDVWIALTRLGIARPSVLDYPVELLPWLGRKIELTTMREVRERAVPTFVKPVENKLFTGFVWKPDATRLKVASFEGDTPVWISEVVDFEAEYRCFILDRELVGVRLYRGDWAKALDRKVVESAVSEYRKGPRAYALDFGVTVEGQTLLVEANDSYALGNYGLPSVLYSRMIEARWEELTRYISGVVDASTGLDEI